MTASAAMIAVMRFAFMVVAAHGIRIVGERSL